MVKSYSTKGPPPINQLSNVVFTDLVDEEVLKYDAASGVWQNGTAGPGDDITCETLQVNQTANIDGTGTIDDLLIKRHFSVIAGLGHRDHYSTNNNGYALAQSNSGTTYINCGPSQGIFFRINNNKTPLYMSGTGSEFFLEVELATGTELKTNNSVGTSGAILTSRGSGSSPIWTEPYYFKAEMSADQTTTTQNTDIDLNIWTASLPSPYNGNNSDLTSATEWTAPTDGLYAVSCKLNMYNGNDFLRKAIVRLNKNSGSGYSVVASGLIVVSIADTTDIVTAQPQFYDLIPMNSGDTFKITFEYSSNGGGLTIFAGSGSAWTITKII